jgi:hypothetical protein
MASPLTSQKYFLAVLGHHSDHTFSEVYLFGCLVHVVEGF